MHSFELPRLKKEITIDNQNSYLNILQESDKIKFHKVNAAPNQQPYFNFAKKTLNQHEIFNSQIIQNETWGKV